MFTNMLPSVYLTVLLTSAVVGKTIINESDTSPNAEALATESVIVDAIVICPHDSELQDGICKCNYTSCEKPPCEKILNFASNYTVTPGSCCPVYTCDACVSSYLIDGTCVCPQNSSLNAKGICECDDRYKSIKNNICECDTNKCPLPNLCDEQSVGIRKQDGCCTEIKCVVCPEDSYPMEYKSDEIDDKCVCHGCPEKLECEDNFLPKVIEKGRSIPGHCCDIYECQSKRRLCQVDENNSYSNGEKWFSENNECICENGVSHCHQIPQFELPKSCLVNNTVYRHLETYAEDQCTNCTCNNGDPVCISHYCDINFTQVYAPECPEINCQRFCKFGYKFNKKGCKMCKCKLPEKTNKHIYAFMNAQNLTEEDVIGILNNYIENISKKISTTTTTEGNLVRPTFDLLELFMKKHNLTENELISKLDSYIKNEKNIKYFSSTEKVERNIESTILTTPKTAPQLDYTHLGVMVAVGIILFLVGSAFGWFISCFCRKNSYKYTNEENNENNNISVKRYSRTPIEQIKHNEKKPLTTT